MTEDAAEAIGPAAGAQDQAVAPAAPRRGPGGRQRRSGPPVLADVARRAGVSLATASRVLNGADRTVGETYRRRVLRAAEDLDYRPNTHAQAMARGASNLVGLLVHDIADPYFAAIAEGVTREAESLDMAVVLASTHRDPEREFRYVSLLRAQRARGIILAGSRTTDDDFTTRLRKELDAFQSEGGRAACIGQDRLGTPAVIPQNRIAARALATEITTMGHHRFAVLAGPQALLTARDRARGFRDGVVAAGGTRDDVRAFHGPFTRDGGYDLVSKLAAAGEFGPRRTSCIVAVNDVMAVGAVAALRDAGLRTPDDVSVAGFDDIPTLRDLSPSLTTVHLPLSRMGQLAAELTLRDSGDQRVIKVAGDVRVRESTRVLPAAPLT